MYDDHEQAALPAPGRAALVDPCIGSKGELLQHPGDRRGVEAAQRQHRGFPNLAEERPAELHRGGATLEANDRAGARIRRANERAGPAHGVAR